MWHEIEGQLHTLLAGSAGTYGVAIAHVESNTEFFHLPDEPFYAASLIKVPIMATVFAQAAAGRLAFAEQIVMRAEDIVPGSGVLSHLSPGLALSIYDLVMLMIVESDNTATNLLIDRVGKQAIQQDMQEWGLANSRFYNKLQIIPAKVAGANTITARDMNHLLQQIAHGKIVSWSACTEMVKIMKRQMFNDGLPSLLPPQREEPIGALPCWEIAHKTGWIEGIEHDMGLLYYPGNTFAVTVLGKEIADRAAAKRVQGRIARLLFDAAAR